MQKFEYKVVAAPRRAKKFKGVKGHSDLFARTVEEVIGEEAVNGWEYFRADTLPADQKGGMMRKGVETYQTLLIFRRAAHVLAVKKPAPAPSPTAAPIPAPAWEEPTLTAEEVDAPEAPKLGAATD